MDLIDRQTAIDAVQGIGRLATLPDNDAVVRMSAVEYVLFNLPSAQPKRPKGKWIPHREKSRGYIGTVLVNVEYDYWFCDNCGYRVENGQPMYNFCPNCGTDTRGDSDE